MEQDVSGILIWFSDVEKQSSVLELCQQQTGHCYAAVGVSPDNIDRTNKKMHANWLLRIEELALAAECVAIFSGLNLTKEMGTHFAQESLLKSCAEIAERLSLPLILHVGNDGGSLTRALEILAETGWICDSGTPAPNHTLILYDALSACSGDLGRVQSVVGNGVCCMISAAGLTDPSEGVKASFEACLRLVPLSQLLACTDSPWKTPQNLSDVYLRTLRNEPCNMAAVIDAMASGLEAPHDSLAQTIRSNSLRVFQIPLSARPQPSPLAVTPREKSLSTEKLGESAPETSKPSVLLSRNARYQCAKCRLLIAGSSDVVTHTVGASRSVFSIGQEGLCSASIFLSYPSTGEPPRAATQAQAGFLIDQEVVHCAGCRAKLGKVSFGDAACGCGTIVRGPVLRINTSKLDQFFQDAETMDTSQLSAILSRLEDQAPRDEEETGQANKAKAKKKKKGKQKMAANKGNYSSFRNKSFIPNASRKKKEVVAGVEEADRKSDQEDEDEKAASGFVLEEAPQWGPLTTLEEEELESEDEEEEEEEEEEA
jgi:Tat protein secretion system quality control protein TatD with DNase activity